MTISTLALNSAGIPYGVHRDHPYQQAVRGIEELQRSRKKNQSKSHHFEHKEGDVGSGRRAGEVGDRRDGDVGVVGGWRVGDVGDAGAGGDGNATDTMQDKRGNTKRSKAAVIFSTDKEDSFTTYAKSKRELDKRKTTTRKRKDEEKDDDGRETEEVEDAEEEEEEEEEEDDDKDDDDDNDDDDDDDDDDNKNDKEDIPILLEKIPEDIKLQVTRMIS